jgi:hypothetical protein
VLDALSSDLGHTLLLRRITWPNISTSPLPEMGYMLWRSEEDGRALGDATRLSGWGTWADDTYFEGSYIRNMSTTVINMLIAVRDAIQ